MPIKKRVLVVLTFVGYASVLTLYSAFLSPWASSDGGVLVALIASTLSAVGLATLLLRGQYSLQSIALSAVIATLIFLVVYAISSELANPGSEFLGAIMTRIFFYFIATGHAVVAFTLCMASGAIVRFLHLDPELKNQRYH